MLISFVVDALLSFFELSQDFLGPFGHAGLAKFEVSLSNLGKTRYVRATSLGSHPACGRPSDESVVGIKLAGVDLLSCLSRGLSLGLCLCCGPLFLLSFSAASGWLFAAVVVLHVDVCTEVDATKVVVYYRHGCAWPSAWAPSTSSFAGFLI